MTRFSRQLPSKIPNSEQESAALNEIGNAGVFMVVGFTFQGPQFVYCNYSEDWERHYKARNFVGADPVVLWSLSNTGSIRWDEIDIPDGKGVFKQARAFNMNFGATASNRFAETSSFISVARHDRPVSDTELVYLEAKFSTWVPILLENPALSAGELAVLSHLKSGLSQSEIAAALNVSESTVKQRAAKLMAKLDAKNRTHAVAIALSRQLI